MADFFSVCIHFNAGNPYLFKVRYINITLKGLKNQLNEINTELNPGDTKKVKWVFCGSINPHWPEKIERIA